jgi:predicted metal-binding membrane protein
MEDMITATALVTAMVIVILIIATATITTVMEILMDIKNRAMAGMTIAMDQGMVPVIGDEIIGQGGRIPF